MVISSLLPSIFYPPVPQQFYSVSGRYLLGFCSVSARYLNGI